MSAAPNERTPLISARSVSKWFGDGMSRRCVLSDVSIDVDRGEIVSLIGRSGVGKSTLLRMIGGLLSSDEGRITIGGASVDTARAAKTFGLMPQSPALFPWRNVE